MGELPQHIIFVFQACLGRWTKPTPARFRVNLRHCESSFCNEGQEVHL